MNHHFFKTIMVGAFAAAMILGGAGCKKSPSVVDVPVTAFSLSATSLELKIDETKQLDVLFFPENANNYPKLIWESDNDKVVTVSQEGLVTAVGVGTAVVTARTNDGSLSETCAVKVWKDKDFEFSAEKYYVWGGAEHPTQLTFTTTPSTLVAEDFIWKLDRPELLDLQLDKVAYARALEGGKCKMTVTPKDGDASLSKSTYIIAYKYRFSLHNRRPDHSELFVNYGIADGGTIDLTNTYDMDNGHPCLYVITFGDFELEPNKNFEIVVEDTGVVDIEKLKINRGKYADSQKYFYRITFPLGTKKGTAKLTLKNTMNAEDGSVLNTYIREFTLLVPETTTTE